MESSMKLPGTHVEITEEALSILGNPHPDRLKEWTIQDLIRAAWNAGYEIDIVELDPALHGVGIDIQVAPELGHAEH
jgi:hypothetical protein